MTCERCRIFVDLNSVHLLLQNRSILVHSVFFRLEHIDDSSLPNHFIVFHVVADRSSVFFLWWAGSMINEEWKCLVYVCVAHVHVSHTGESPHVKMYKHSYRCSLQKNVRVRWPTWVISSDSIFFGQNLWFVLLFLFRSFWDKVG